MLAIYLRDRILTMSASKLHPTTDNFILPFEHLHITPQTRAGLHGQEDDLDRYRVQVRTIEAEDMGHINRYRAEYRRSTPRRNLQRSRSMSSDPPGEGHQHGPT